MSTKEQFQNDLKQALRNRDTVRRDALRLLLGAVKNAEIEKGGELTESELNALLHKQAKQRRDSITEFERGGRADLVAHEQAELAVIESYLPRQMTEEEIRRAASAQIAAAGASGPRDMGKVMGPLMGQLRGRADGATVQRIVRDLLTQDEAGTERSG
ncbi:MAG: GatB/YqeY domain-containing protein [Ardenticatenaceae bacterium]|nr:GatB/YqeY domain-containing protein [Ardenticatenaceae bacterium]HBY98762.1 glutamyl-tRNA amidotransferase [Chloroflexota bacterium]